MPAPTVSTRTSSWGTSSTRFRPKHEEDFNTKTRRGTKPLKRHRFLSSSCGFVPLCLTPFLIHDRPPHLHRSRLLLSAREPGASCAVARRRVFYRASFPPV